FTKELREFWTIRQPERHNRTAENCLDVVKPSQTSITPFFKKPREEDILCAGYMVFHVHTTNSFVSIS
ncbi:hypothetical protein L9F63_018031, partial [Diploptera punctata]